MKILALSDTHLTGPLPAELLSLAAGAEIVVHAGDFVARAAFDSLAQASRRLIAVHGNSDAAELKELLPETATFEAGGVRFGVVHAGRHATDATNMRFLAKEMGVGALIFGHLHRPLVERTDVLLICPGSPTMPRMADPSVIELTVSEKGVVSGNIVNVATGTPCGYIQFARSL